MYLYFLLLLHIEMTQVFNILPQISAYIFYTVNIIAFDGLAT